MGLSLATFQHAGTLLSDNNALNRRAIKGTSTFTCLNLPPHLTGKHACLMKGMGIASNPEEAPALNFWNWQQTTPSNTDKSGISNSPDCSPRLKERTSGGGWFLLHGTAISTADGRGSSEVLATLKCLCKWSCQTGADTGVVLDLVCFFTKACTAGSLENSLSKNRLRR